MDDPLDGTSAKDLSIAMLPKTETLISGFIFDANLTPCFFVTAQDAPRWANDPYNELKLPPAATFSEGPVTRGSTQCTLASGPVNVFDKNFINNYNFLGLRCRTATRDY